IPEGPRGFTSGGYLLWPLFGTANHLHAAISLLLITVWLIRLGSRYVFVILPMFFVLGTTLYAMLQQVDLQWSWFGPEQNNLLFVLGAIIFVFAIWISITALSTLTKDKELPLEDD